MYERILLALDASEHRDSLVSATAALAARSHARVLVIHVRPTDAGDPENVAEEARAQLERSGVRATATTVVGDRRFVPGAIASAAQAFGAELIVMGSRALGELRALMAGSVSRAVITRTDLPVLLMKRERAAAHQLTEARVVLAPVAGPEDVEPLLLAFSGLGSVGQVVVLHVLQVVPAYAGPAACVEPAEEAEAVLQAAQQRLAQAGYRVSTRMGSSIGMDLGHVIADEARVAGADLVVVGSHRPAGVEGVLLGSTARAVLHHADQPVLITARVAHTEAVS